MTDPAPEGESLEDLVSRISDVIRFVCECRHRLHDAPTTAPTPAVATCPLRCHERTHAPQQTRARAATVYSITSSATARSSAGMSGASALAVLRLKTSSSFMISGGATRLTSSHIADDSLMH